jgi:hypothetical protein
VGLGDNRHSARGALTEALGTEKPELFFSRRRIFEPKTFGVLLIAIRPKKGVLRSAIFVLSKSAGAVLLAPQKVFHNIGKEFFARREHLENGLRKLFSPSSSR